jgi:superoxide dismutase, Cu-Zn family
MKLRTLLPILALVMVAAAPASAAKRAAYAVLTNTKGEKIGTAKLRQIKRGVKINLNVSDLPPGTHALHIHAVGKCDPPDFKSAGPHFNPGDKKHGLKNPAGPHAGDLPNFEVGKDGRATVSVIASHVTLGMGPDSLFHPGGTALVIHEKADDYMTDPAGNAGSRIACGVIER